MICAPGPVVALIMTIAAGLSTSSATLATVPAPAAAPECREAAELPAGSSVESRRITCEIPGPLRFAVQAAEFGGLLLRQLDLAAWRASDALSDAKALDPVPGGRGLGWLTFVGTSTVDVTFFNELEGKPFAIAEARYEMASDSISHASRLATPRPATDREERSLKARQLALSQNPLHCTPTMNTAIIEADIENQREIRVYLLSAWTNEVAPMGGHHRYSVSPEGNRVLKHFSQTRTCINLGNDDLKRSVALPVSDIQSDTPTDIHVFLSLQYGRPLYVFTQRNDRVWKVDGSRISLLEQGDTLHETILKWKSGLPPLEPEDASAPEPDEPESMVGKERK